MYYVYILRCVDDSFYIGHTTDITDRIMRHNEGRADCSYTINRRPFGSIMSRRCRRGALRLNASGNSSGGPGARKTHLFAAP